MTLNPIFGCGVEMTPDINPIYIGLERCFPRDSKNVSYVGVGLDLFRLDFELWVVGWVGLSKNIVNPTIRGLWN